MNKILTLIAAALLMLPTLSTFAGDAPHAGDKPKTPAEGGNKKHGYDAYMRDIIAANPELKGVDPSTPEGQEKINGFMEAKKFATMIAANPELKGVDPSTPEGQEKINAFAKKRDEARMAKDRATEHTELNKQLGMSQEEFDAMKPLLLIVENLRAQKNIIDYNTRGSKFGGIGIGKRERGNFGDTKLDPTVVEILNSSQALNALVHDTQANATEITSAVARLRKARDGFTAVLDKAQKDLRAVLTPRQEAMLVDRGTLR